MDYTDKYKKSTLHTDMDKARVIKNICKHMWDDELFYKTMRQYARAASGDVIG